MSGLFQALAIALLPAAGNILGGAIAEWRPVSGRVLSYALHAATGIVLAVVGIELVADAIETSTPWIPIVAFIAGGLFFMAVDHTTETLAARRGGDTGPWLIYFGVAMDLFSDGIMIGAGSAVAFSLALLIALGQVAADVPEGFAVVANMKRNNIAERTRRLVSASFALPVLAGTAFSYLVVRGRSELVQYSLLMFAAGVLVTVVVEELVPEAHAEGSDARGATLSLVGGFALFSFLSAYL